MASDPFATPPPPSPPSDPPPPPPPTAPDAPGTHARPLRRRRSGRVLGGVANGIAATYGVDVVLVRVLWVVAALAGVGIPLYLIAWIAIPYGDDSTPPPHFERKRDLPLVVGIVLVAIGAIIVLHEVFFVRDFGRFAFPLVLIAAGAAFLIRRADQDSSTPASPARAAFAAPTPTVTPSTTSTDTETAMPEPDTATIDGPAPEVTPPGAPPPTSAWGQTAPWPTAPRPTPPAPPRRRERPFLTPVTIGVLLLVGGVTALLGASDAVDVNLTVAFAIGLAIVAAALVISAWVGRAHGLILIGLLLVGATAASSILDVPLHGGWGDQHYAPTTRSTLQRSYALSGGRLTVDLVDAPLANRTTHVDATLGFGELDVDVPSSVRVDVRARAGAGAVEVFGQTDNGVHSDAHEVFPSTGHGTLRLDLRVGAGHVVVRRITPDGTVTELAGAHA